MTLLLDVFRNDPGPPEERATFDRWIGGTMIGDLNEMGDETKMTARHVALGTMVAQVSDAHIAAIQRCGWSIAEDLADLEGARRFVLDLDEDHPFFTAS